MYMQPAEHHRRNDKLVYQPVPFLVQSSPPRIDGLRGGSPNTSIALAPQLAMLFLIDFVVVQVAAHHNSEDQTDLESRSARRANGIQEACRSGFHFAKAFMPWIIL